MNKFKQADLSKVKTISLKSRASKTEIASLGKVIRSGQAKDFFGSLPKFLKASDLIEFMNRVLAARKKGRPFHVFLGAHVIKVGLSPVLIDLMKNNIVTGLSLNSAGLIHDLELAFAGKTSEDVLSGLEDGTFGMSKETGQLFAEVVQLAETESTGLGEAAGRFINGSRAKFKRYSLFSAADKISIPATVHLAVGTDIVSQHNNFRPGPAAEASYRDFKILAEILGTADRGGAIANIGSAVVLPEVFLKALTVSRNLSKHNRNITTANFDMINHYRPAMNVVTRPTSAGGRGFSFIGHHEIMIPLLAWGLKSFKHAKK
jgi:hypothetical protein